MNPQQSSRLETKTKIILRYGLLPIGLCLILMAWGTFGIFRVDENAAVEPAEPEETFAVPSFAPPFSLTSVSLEEETDSPEAAALNTTDPAPEARPERKQALRSGVAWDGLSFELNEGATALKWRTRQEQALAYFVVERSLDARHFEAIGELEVHRPGSSQESKLYTFADPDLDEIQMPRVYYRVRSEGLDGKHSYSPIYTYELPTDLKLFMRIESLSQQELAIRYATRQTNPIMLQVLDASGAMIWEKELLGELKPQWVKLDIQGWDSGTYFLMLSDERDAVMEQFELSEALVESEL